VNNLREIALNKNIKYKKYLYLFIIACTFFLVFSVHISFIPKKPSIPRTIKSEDIQVLEQYLHFKFPKSTDKIKTYNTDDSLYVSFGFDEKEVDQFIDSLDWENNIDEEFRKDIKWQSDDIEKYYDKWPFTGPPYKADNDFMGPSPGPELKLEWWNPNKNNIENILWIRDTTIKDKKLYFNLTIILERRIEKYQVYVEIEWIDTSGMWEYLRDFRKSFPLTYKWETRDRESATYPLLGNN